MRSRDDLRRQARTLSPGQRRRSRRASIEWLDGEAGEWRGAGCQMVVCDRPCADLVLKRPCVSLAWVVAVAFLNVQARTVARTVSPYRARVGCDRGGEDDARNFCWSRRFERSAGCGIPAQRREADRSQ